MGQNARQKLRTHGRYAKTHLCEWCEQPAPIVDYCSLPSVPLGFGLIFCKRRACIKQYKGLTQFEVADKLISKMEERTQYKHPSYHVKLLEWSKRYPEEAEL